MVAWELHHIIGSIKRLVELIGFNLQLVIHCSKLLICDLFSYSYEVEVNNFYGSQGEISTSFFRNCNKFNREQLGCYFPDFVPLSVQLLILTDGMLYIDIQLQLVLLHIIGGLPLNDIQTIYLLCLAVRLKNLMLQQLSLYMLLIPIACVEILRSVVFRRSCDRISCQLSQTHKPLMNDSLSVCGQFFAYQPVRPF